MRLLKLSDDEGDTPGGKHPSVVSVLPEEMVDTEDIDGPPGNKVLCGRYGETECPADRGTE